MPWVKFTDNFNYTPADKRTVTIAYKKGMIENVTTPCAEKAIELGRAVKSKRPAKDENASRDT